MGVLCSDSIIHFLSICLPVENSSIVWFEYRVVVSVMYIKLPFLRCIPREHFTVWLRDKVHCSPRVSEMQGNITQEFLMR